MLVFAKICLIGAHACALGILAVPFGARWFFPVAPVAQPESFGAMLLLMVDTISMAGRGAWSMAAVAALFGLVLLLSLIAYPGIRRAEGASRARWRCAVPFLVGVVTLIAAIVLDDSLPELRQ